MNDTTIQTTLDLLVRTLIAVCDGYQDAIHRDDVKRFRDAIADAPETIERLIHVFHDIAPPETRNSVGVAMLWDAALHVMYGALNLILDNDGAVLARHSPTIRERIREASRNMGEPRRAPGGTLMGVN